MVFIESYFFFANFVFFPLSTYSVPFGPYSLPNVPRGLEILLTLDQLIIEQQVEMLEGKNFSLIDC